ncbi:MAG: hypothetical protein F6K31_22320 [Symploca sp. SIO2G7]|nr:hypothetical protein [Symploca sp. SIO2G7]
MNGQKVDWISEETSSQEIAIFNGQSLSRLFRSITLSQGQFALILARCNYETCSQQMWQQLQALEGSPVRELVLQDSSQTLYSKILTVIDGQQTCALSVFGLDSVAAIEQMLISTNQIREEFRKTLNFPLVLWITDEILHKLTRFAPDFKSWAATSIQFKLTTKELFRLWHQTADELFATILAKNAGEFIPNDTLNLAPGCRRRQELESALQDLSYATVDIEPALFATWQFILGRDAFSYDQIDIALQQYQQSLSFWQHKVRGELPISNPQFLERVGVLFLHMGWCYCRQAQLQPLQSNSKWQQAKELLGEAIEVFAAAGHSEWVAQLTIQLGQILQNLQNWTELQALALKSIDAPQTQIYPERLAQAYGFLAAVADGQANWLDAEILAQTALQILEQSPSPQFQQQGAYLLLLAKAQRQMNCPIAAITTLEQAIEVKILEPNSIEQQPRLYISILEELRSLYFEQKRYLEAFVFKQERCLMEQQYGFCPFLGAVPLQPLRKAGQYGIRYPTFQEKPLPLEIAATGRQQDVNRLIERLSRNDHKLTVIHGASGVGKSSLIHAGLVPALESRILGTRAAMPIVQKVYKDWVGELGKLLAQRLASWQISRQNCSNQQSKSSNLPYPFGNPIASTEQAYRTQQDNSWNSSYGYIHRGRYVSEQLSSGQKTEHKASTGKKDIPFFPTIYSPNLQAILEQLQLSCERNLLTVLIFDQFEEFFFLCTNPAERRQFYDFLEQCLNLPYVKVILSLREDYLHYLLECEYYSHPNAINYNILERQLRYSLRDLSSEEAKNLIATLSNVSQFQLEESLIEAVVQDLASKSGTVRLIELQVVGSQLQAEKITTTAQYRSLGTDPKAALVERSLLDIISDCGQENEDTVWQLLFSLTNEQGTCPWKTQAELKMRNIELILKILVGSGLVFRVPGETQDQYQLVHDYLVKPIRQKYNQRAQQNIITQLEKSEIELRRLRQQRLRAIAVGTTMAVLAVTSGFLGWRAEGQKRRAEALSENAHLTTLSASSEVLFASNKKFEALLEGLRAARFLKALEKSSPPSLGVKPDTHLQVAIALSQAVYGVAERNQLEGHTDVIWDVSFSPDGQLIASASRDRTVKLWHPNGSLVTTLKGHQDSVTSVSFSTDSQLIVSGSWDGTVKLWHNNGSLVRTFQSHISQLSSVSFSPNGQLIASGGGKGTIKLWKVNGELVKIFKKQQGKVQQVSFSPDGKMIASVSEDKTIRLWSLEGKLLQTFKGHEGNVNCVAFSPNGKLIASASDDQTVKLWNYQGKLLKTFPKDEQRVLEVAFSTDGQLIASGSDDNTVKLWTVEGKLLKTLKGHSDSVTSVSFSSSTIQNWDLDADKSSLTTNVSSQYPVLPQSPMPSLASASYDKTIKIWSLDNQSRVILQGHQEPVRDVQFAPDSQLIATVGNDRTVKLWHRNGRLLKTLEGHGARIDSLSFSADGQRLASASRDGTVKIWHRNGNLINTLEGHQDWVLDVSFSPDSQRLASASRDGTVKLWHRNGNLIKTLRGHTDRVNAVNFSSDGQLLASASDDQTVGLWTADGVLLKTITGHNNWVLDVNFSPDAQQLASASYDNTVKLWSRDGELQTTLKGHTDSVAKVVWSPTGEILATTSWDNQVQLWRLDDTLLKTLAGHQARVTSVSWSHDGKTLASASLDNTVMVWNLDVDHLLDHSCNWLRDYLQNNPKVRAQDRELCDPIESSKKAIN